MLPRALGEVPAVQLADGIDRGLGLLSEDLLRRRALPDHVVGLELVLEANAVEVLTVPERFLALAVGRAQLGVRGEQLLAAGVQAQVHRPAAEMLGELLVLELPLLPTGGDGGDPASHAQRADRFAQRGLEALRAEEHHRRGPLRSHRARTLAVRPMKSSMPRSSS